jgi:hypothetical protein
MSVEFQRRKILQIGGALMAATAIPAWADLAPTPAQMRGPFYPVTFPHRQAGRLSRPRAAYPIRPDAPGLRHFHHANVCGGRAGKRTRLPSFRHSRRPRASLIVALAPSSTGELAGQFNIVLAGDGRLQRGALPEACRQGRLGL